MFDVYIKWRLDSLKQLILPDNNSLKKHTTIKFSFLIVLNDFGYKIILANVELNKCIRIISSCESWEDEQIEEIHSNEKLVHSFW